MCADIQCCAQFLDFCERTYGRAAMERAGIRCICAVPQCAGLIVRVVGSLRKPVKARPFYAKHVNIVVSCPRHLNAQRRGCALTLGAGSAGRQQQPRTQVHSYRFSFSLSLSALSLLLRAAAPSANALSSRSVNYSNFLRIRNCFLRGNELFRRIIDAAVEDRPPRPPQQPAVTAPSRQSAPASSATSPTATDSDTAGPQSPPAGLDAVQLLEVFFKHTCRRYGRGWRPDEMDARSSRKCGRCGAEMAEPSDVCGACASEAPASLMAEEQARPREAAASLEVDLAPLRGQLESLCLADRRVAVQPAASNQRQAAGGPLFLAQGGC